MPGTLVARAWLPSHLVGALDDLVRVGGIVGYLRSAAVTMAVSAGLTVLALRAQASQEV